jgi:hypothetical protein
MGSSKSSSTTVGYWYGLGMHMVLCHGPVDAITEVRVGEKTAWSGTADGNLPLTIQQRELFGGEEREGGVEGTLDVLFGAASQTPNSYLQARLGAEIPAFRGVLSVVWRGLVAAMNPYIKPWAFRVQRTPEGGCPLIGADANPASIIRECLVNPHWGMGYPEADLDLVSFAAAAATLHAEAFGLSLLWSQEQSIEDFILSVLQHIDGVLYVHPRSGLFTLRLAREDYDPATLPVLSPANVLAIEAFSRPAWGEVVNQVTVVYRDGPTEQDASITVQDLAVLQLQGGVVATTVHYPGISHAALAQRVALRDLRQLSSTLARVTLVANRQASLLDIGNVFILSWPAYGVSELILRVTRIDYGTLNHGEVRIEAVQDVFALPNALYTPPQASRWEDPVSVAAPCPAQWVYEVPYWQIVKDVVGEIPSILNDIDATEGMVATLGARPSADALDYAALAWEAATAGWVSRARGAFAPTALLETSVPQAAESLTVALTQAIDLAAVKVGQFALCGEEWFLVTSVDTADVQVTLARGVLDTVPMAHAAGSRVWFVQPHFIQPEYVVGETAELRLCPKTGKGELAVAQAATVSCEMTQRFIRPYPPGNVRLNGVAYPAVVAGDVTVSWANRNRVNQTAGVILQAEGNITPEDGQTTTLRFYDQANVLRSTFSALTGNSQVWSLAQMMAAGAGASGSVRVEIEAQRSDEQGTFESLYRQSITVARAGYGLNYGKYYGGV